MSGPPTAPRRPLGRIIRFAIAKAMRLDEIHRASGGQIRSFTTA
jgi:hypothetical protein